jgi:hypothetical protein
VGRAVDEAVADITENESYKTLPLQEAKETSSEII